MKRLVVVVALWVLGTSMASAEVVYRCGPASNSYSRVPCHDGRAVDVSDRRNAESVEDARRVARVNQLLGNSLEQERIKRENTPPRVGSLSPLPREAKAESKAERTKKKKTSNRPEDFRVSLPKQKKSKAP